MMSAKYFEYYTIILRGAVFSWTHCTLLAIMSQKGKGARYFVRCVLVFQDVVGCLITHYRTWMVFPIFYNGPPRSPSKLPPSHG